MSGALSVKVSGLDFVLKLSQLWAFGANFLDLPGVFLFLHFHASHLSGEVLLTARHVDLAGRTNGA